MGSRDSEGAGVGALHMPEFAPQAYGSAAALTLRVRMDRSNGYEGVAAQFLARRGSGRSTGVGVNAVRKWARTLPRACSVIDLGCGPGFPITEVLVAEGLNVFAIDAAPSFVQAFRRNLPNTPVVCEAVQDSRFFDRTFDAVLAWGLIFLLSAEDQRRIIQRAAAGCYLLRAQARSHWRGTMR